MSYFVVNKQHDYDCGCLYNGEYREGRLSVCGDGENSACFISRLYDSRTENTEWGRFLVDAGDNVGAGLQISFYTSESPEIVYHDKNILIQDLISDKKITVDEKKEAFESLFQKRFVGFKDILLYGIRGRYLFYLLELYQQENENTCGDMCIFFPKTSWLQYLPAVYRQDPKEADFSERFLGVFQSFFEDRQREIQNSAELLHPVSCGRNMLEELGKWHDISGIYLWPDGKLNELIRRAPYLRAKHGTVGGMKEYLTLYTGTVPEIREDENDTNQVTIAVPERYLTDIGEYRLLLRVITQMLPAGMEVQVIPQTQPGKTVKKVSIGVNSFIGDSESGALDRTFAPGIVLGDDREAKE